MCCDHIYTVGNAAANHKKTSSDFTVSEDDLRKLRTRYSAMRDPLLAYDPTSDVEFEDFIQNIATARTYSGATLRRMEEKKPRRCRLFRGIKKIFKKW